MSSWLRRLLGQAEGRGGGAQSGRTRLRGDPPSANGASSLHLSWELPGTFAAASVVLEVIEPPTVDRLYFWALQASFVSGGIDRGAAHLGLQWHPSYPACTAANWGGYRAGGGELDGSRSHLPSTLANPHTRDYRWEAARPYKLSIERSPERTGSWRGSVTDLGSGATTAIRDLHPDGTHVHRFVMWSEVFARCDHPSVAVRWSAPEAVADDGSVHRPGWVSVNYQSYGDGGCSNTCSSVVDGGLVQRTNVDRTTPQGSRLAVGGSPGPPAPAV